MLKLNDFILLKAIYSEELHNAILKRDSAAMNAIVQRDYSEELEDGYVSLEAIDTDRLFIEYSEILNDEEVMERLII
ncbi:hypothetical protein BC351_00515 [Paenibacillus ferrarius]|uniref:Uncharacterized protein n=1 Tax=Paenibacillus ferrarius TaxID=1469647 RepID=A0A1V4HS33_9BACL|nr:hypothetical protein [Paenibacillus ferrarius]OPH61759.1 hypothetical protein BC351_00515 [Paenibacillus ferrarius]